MQPHQEQALKDHLDTLDDKQYAAAKDHADAADHEEHPSYLTLAKWGAAIMGIPVTAGLGWKIIKIIKGH